MRIEQEILENFQKFTNIRMNGKKLKICAEFQAISMQYDELPNQQKDSTESDVSEIFKTLERH